MNFLPEHINEYAAEHSQPEPELLAELFKETWQKALVPRMISGHFQGRVLSMISKLVAPKTILEIGTYTGYSALCLAEGMIKEGVLHTIDHNEELYDFQRKYFDRSDYGEQIFQHAGEALDILPEIEGPFDLVFIDADKANYSNYFNEIIEKMNPGGVILSDNVLWSGKVTEPPKLKDDDTKALIEYNKLINQDERVETVLLPIRDGLTISRVK
ncbi:O-methyltransferase [Lutimonas zeaxanthinifaciens]|uniref:O-methyltransferase n=1 Tax=Lutimonas zeaxanthinifaciens TaxID=3060215 RepID=UPI00265D2BA2|nr:O-methyltransferase [Lutimonas sp. YSD2104]WKK65998.1 O-methyltransferase [Lutimonas sp. YSD2104]